MFEEFDARSQTKILRDDDRVGGRFLTLATLPPMRGRRSLQHAISCSVQRTAGTAGEEPNICLRLPKRTDGGRSRVSVCSAISISSI